MRSPKYGPRALTALVAVATLATTAAACGGGGGGDDNGSGDKKVSLRFTWWGDPGRQKLTEQAIAVFEKKYPNIHISEEPTSWDSYYDTLNTKLASGNAPDIINVEVRALADYARRGVFADLSGKIDTSHMDKNLLATGKVNDKLVAVPTGGNVLAMLENPKVLKKAGVKAPDDTTWTWDDYLKLSAKITKKLNNKKMFGSEYTFNSAYLQIYARQKGEQLYSGTKIGVSAATVKAWLSNFKTLIDTKGSPDAATSQQIGKNSIESSLVSTNKGAFGMWWSNQVGESAKTAGGPITLLRMPKIAGASTSGVSMHPSMFWAENAKTKYPDAAAKFINFMVNSPKAGKILMTDRGMPINLNVRKEIAPTLPKGAQVSVDYLNNISGELASPPPAPPKGADKIPDILQRYGEDYVFGKKSLDAAANGFIKEANGALG